MYASVAVCDINKHSVSLLRSCSDKSLFRGTIRRLVQQINPVIFAAI